MSWVLRFASGIEKDLRGIDKSDARFIIDSLESFAAAFSPAYEAELMKTGKVKMLVGNWKGFHRLRLRSWRAIYRSYGQTLVILVVRVAHRREVYR